MRLFWGIKTTHVVFAAIAFGLYGLITEHYWLTYAALVIITVERGIVELFSFVVRRAMRRVEAETYESLSNILGALTKDLTNNPPTSKP